MIIKDRKLVLEYATRKISETDFISKYPHKLDNNYMVNCFSKVLESKDTKDLEYLFMMLNFIEEKSLCPILCELLVECWHSKHDNIATILQFDVDYPECVDFVVEAIHLECKLWYPSYRESFIKKCTYILAYLETEKALEKLKELSNSSDDLIKKYALDQINEIEN
ncbi:hypothetical protein [Flammeovirga aprica]|uniref:Immunity protein 30 domain-containing protein n=1 Tax=Flammeovirga aprica JL-4 TaxID=694437 RepID=A0A7X9XDL5_9BACT|nr:hypothetical protein [Flammeovirga aprica]NME73016.1 hypothetical protein [Flammeovirga aprica JL-4]